MIDSESCYRIGNRKVIFFMKKSAQKFCRVNKNVYLCNRKRESPVRPAPFESPRAWSQQG